MTVGSAFTLLYSISLSILHFFDLDMRPEVLWATLPQRLGYAFREGCLRGHRPTHGRSALALSALWLPLKFRLLKLQNNLNHIVLAHLNTNGFEKFTTDVLFPNQDNF